MISDKDISNLKSTWWHHIFSRQQIYSIWWLIKENSKKLQFWHRIMYLLCKVAILDSEHGEFLVHSPSLLASGDANIAEFCASTTTHSRNNPKNRSIIAPRVVEHIFLNHTSISPFEIRRYFVYGNVVRHLRHLLFGSQATDLACFSCAEYAQISTRNRWTSKRKFDQCVHRVSCVCQSSPSKSISNLHTACYLSGTSWIMRFSIQQAFK